MNLRAHLLKRLAARWLAWSGLAGLLLAGLAAQGRPATEARQHRAEADALFTNASILTLRLDIPKAGMDALRREPHKYVRATLHEGNTTYSNVAVHLKGSAGSMRGVDDKPGLTLHLDLFEPDAQRFHGLKKLHLNNSVQDPSYFSECVCDEMFRQAGVPATRQAHALVTLNNRKLGLYVLLESIDRDFLAQYFQKTKGNLYGQPGGGDITDNIDRMAGEGPLTRNDLKALADATQEKDPDRRYERLQQTLDIDRFLSFMAVEVMACHWDGYTFARHNYRAYHDMDTGRMVFMPHDVDQMFNDANLAILPGVNGLVAQTILNTPQTRRAYRVRFASLFTNVFDLPTITNRFNQRLSQVLPTIKAFDPNLANDVVNNVNNLKGRLTARWQGLNKQLGEPVKTLKFDHDIARLTDWRMENEKGGARLERGKDKDGRQTLRIAATGNTASSWRARVMLDGGRYRFEGQARSAGLMPVIEEKKGEGAGLRISGNLTPRQNKLSGDTPWQPLAYEFEAIAPNDEVELVCELRATKGDVWFDADSLRLVRLK